MSFGEAPPHPLDSGFRRNDVVGAEMTDYRIPSASLTSALIRSGLSGSRLI